MVAFLVFDVAVTEGCEQELGDVVAGGKSEKFLVELDHRTELGKGTFCLQALLDNVLTTTKSVVVKRSTSRWKEAVNEPSLRCQMHCLTAFVVIHKSKIMVVLSIATMNPEQLTHGCIQTAFIRVMEGVSSEHFCFPRWDLDQYEPEACPLLPCFAITQH